MRDRLNSTPTWALFLILWLAWTAVLFAVGIIPTRDYLWSLGLGAAVGLLVGAAMTFALKARLRWENRALGDTPKDARSQALRAAVKGPIPTDPELRAAALAVAEEQLRQLRRSRRLMIVALVMSGIAAVGLAFTSSPWHLLLLVFYLPTLHTFFFAPNRLRKRISQLSEPE
jgi:hypothetical protein